MKEHPDHHDAELLLRLYELRREEKLRLARGWLIGEFHADSMDDFQNRFPAGSKENEYFRMVVSYWDMAASIVEHGLINEELFFESNAELWITWSKVKPLASEGRTMYKNPHLWRNLEALAEKYEKWMEARGLASRFSRERLLPRMTAEILSEPDSVAARTHAASEA